MNSYDWLLVLLYAGDQAFPNDESYGVNSYLINLMLRDEELRGELLPYLSLLGLPLSWRSRTKFFLNELRKLTTFIPPLVSEHKADSRSYFHLTEEGKARAKKACEVLSEGMLEKIVICFRGVYAKNPRMSLGQAPKKRYSSVVDWAGWQKYLKALLPAVEGLIGEFTRGHPMWIAEARIDCLPPRIEMRIGLRAEAKKRRRALHDSALSKPDLVTWMDESDQDVPGAFAAKVEALLGLNVTLRYSGKTAKNPTSLCYELRPQQYADKPPSI